MESEIVRSLRPEFEPAAVVWSDAIPGDTLQFKKGKFGCILYLFAQADQAVPRAVLGMLGVDGRFLRFSIRPWKHQKQVTISY